MRVAFAVKEWAAIAPSLQSKEQWINWATAPYCPNGTAVVDLPHVPPMARRRLGHLAKMAVSVADAVLVGAQCIDMPIIWASRYGDAERSIALLKSQASDEQLSPTAFALSVHNGVGAQHSILRGIVASAVCIASSRFAPESGVVEAVGMLNDGATEVLLVCYDAPLPSDYVEFHDEPLTEFAWAVLLGPLSPGGKGFELSTSVEPLFEKHVEPVPGTLPHGLDVLHFLLREQQPNLNCVHESGQWTWERVHA